MSNIKSIIENIQQEDLVNAKDLIKQELLSRLGNLLESAIEDIAPSMIAEEEKEQEPKKKSSMFVTRKKQNEDEDDNKKKSKSMRKESFEQEEAINDIDDTSDEFEDFIDQVHQIVQEIEEETGEELTEDEIIVIGQEYLELLNEDLPGNQEAIDVAEPKGKITKADLDTLRLRSNKKGK